MNLAKKKLLAAKTLGVGKGRIQFNTERLSEVKEAITKEDIKYLYKAGAINIKEVKGRKKIVRNKRKRGLGKIKMKIKKGKQEYVKITRKLRRYVKELLKQGEISKKEYWELRKKIKARAFKSKAQLKMHLQEEK